MKIRFLKAAHWAKALHAVHQDALLIAGRVGVAATLAYLIAVLQHLPETYWPVMSAVIVARGGAKGAGGSASDRLIGTLAGAAVGLGASFLHRRAGGTGGGDFGAAEKACFGARFARISARRVWQNVLLRCERGEPRRRPPFRASLPAAVRGRGP